MRSNIGFGIYHEDINTMRGAVCPGGSSAAAVAARNAGTAGCNLNKEFFNLYRLRFLGHRIEAYAAMAAV